MTTVRPPDAGSIQRDSREELQYIITGRVTSGPLADAVSVQRMRRLVGRRRPVVFTLMFGAAIVNVVSVSVTMVTGHSHHAPS